MSCSLIAISYKYIRKSLIWPKTSMQCSFRHSKRTCSLDVLVILSNQVNMGIIKKIILGHLQKSALNLNDIKMQLIHYRQMQINNKKIFYSHFCILLNNKKHSTVVQRWSQDSACFYLQDCFSSLYIWKPQFGCLPRMKHWTLFICKVLPNSSYNWSIRTVCSPKYTDG